MIIITLSETAARTFDVGDGVKLGGVAGTFTVTGVLGKGRLELVKNP